MLGFAISHATFKTKKLTITPAIGSSIRQLSPKSIAPEIPNTVPIDESASDL